ncbi:unnamed protein product, partial [Effrenium voratum]
GCQRSCAAGRTSASPRPARSPSATWTWSSACWACPPWARPSAAWARCQASTSVSRTRTTPRASSTPSSARWTMPSTCRTASTGTWPRPRPRPSSPLRPGGPTSQAPTPRPWGISPP